MKTAAWARFLSFPPSLVLWVQGASFHSPGGRLELGGPLLGGSGQADSAVQLHGLPCPLWASFPQCPECSRVLKLDERPPLKHRHTFTHTSTPTSPLWKDLEECLFQASPAATGPGIKLFFICWFVLDLGAPPGSAIGVSLPIKLFGFSLCVWER